MKEKKELLQRLETLINSDDVYAEIAEKLLNKVAPKKKENISILVLIVRKE